MIITCDDSVDIQNGEHIDNILITSITGVQLLILEDSEGNINIKFNK